MTIDELIDALEKAEGPSMELSRHIARLIGWVRLSKSEAKHATVRWVQPQDCIDGKPVFCQMHGTALHRDPPHFTASLDAALTLVPEGMEWSLTTLYGEATTEVGLNNTTGMHSTGRRKDGNVAIALCIAALKVRRNA